MSEAGDLPILWHCADARSFRVLWMFEELGLAYQLRLLPFPPRVKAPDYLEENPLGTVPLYVEGAVRMTESVAILQYLAARHGRFAPGTGDPGYADHLDGLLFGEAALTWPLALVLRYAKLEPAGRQQPQVAEDYARWFAGRLTRIERRLADGRAHYAGEPFGIADISIGYALLLASRLGLDKGFGPQTGRYWERLRSRDRYLGARLAQKGEGGA